MIQNEPVVRMFPWIAVQYVNYIGDAAEKNTDIKTYAYSECAVKDNNAAIIFLDGIS